MKIGLACRFQFRNEPRRAVNYANTLLEMLGTKKPAGSVEGIGTGTAKNPYKPTTMGGWYGLSQKPPTDDPVFIEVGGRLIARWGKAAKRYQNYCTDVTGAGPAAHDATVGKQDYETYVATWGDAFAKMDKKSGIDPKLPAYTKKAQRVAHINDRLVATKSRLLLQGDEHACDDCPELASSLCSLFIAEAYRASETFVIGLMLLDLIETGTTYGKGGAKTYTWQSMLSHDVSGIPGRGDGMKTLGKHPMAGAGTAANGRGMMAGKGGNEVADRAISIMSVWLSHYLAPRNRECKYFILEGTKGSWTAQSQRAKEDDLLRKDCLNAVANRASDFGVKIGGTTVQYEDIAGNPV